ncbi:MAG: metal-dependent transcriptional regulator [Thermodesulfobacteriota bacterium]
MLSQSIEDYLKVIYEIQNSEGKVTTNSLSQKLNIAPASVTGMIKKLSSKKLITHKKYQGVRLTQAGENIALEIIRHHRLIELYLKEALGVPWDKVHEEAEKWEHVISEDIEDRMDEFLGHPTSDPHGSPIPTRDGKVVERKCLCLADVEPGHKAVIAEVSDHDPSMLRYLGKLGFYPKTKIKIDSVEPFNGPMKINIKNKVEILGREVAKHISVTDVKKVA